MPTEEEERKAKAERAKKLLAQRQKKAKANAPASPALTDGDLNPPSTRTSLSIDDRSDAGIPPPPKGERRKKVEGAEASAAEQTEALAAPANAEAGPSNLSLLVAERAELQAQLAARDGEVASARADRKLLEEGRGIIAGLEEEKAALEARISGLEEDTKASRSAAAELDSVKEQFEVLQKSYDNARATSAAADNARTEEDQRHAAALAELQRSLSRAREREGGLEAEVARLRQRESELATIVAAKSTEEGSTKTQLEELRRELDSVRAEREKLDADHSVLVTRHAELESLHTSLASELEALRADHSSLSTSMSTAESSLASTQTDLTTASSSLSAERKRADAAERKREALQRENADLFQQLEELRGKVASVMEEKADLLGQLDTKRRPRPEGVNHAVDAILPANVRHKRQVSLTALKARMGSYRGGMDTVVEDKPQFSDEIMFCCPACMGDLITL